MILAAHLYGAFSELKKATQITHTNPSTKKLALSLYNLLEKLQPIMLAQIENNEAEIFPCYAALKVIADMHLLILWEEQKQTGNTINFIRYASKLSNSAKYAENITNVILEMEEILLGHDISQEKIILEIKQSASSQFAEIKYNTQQRINNPENYQLTMQQLRSLTLRDAFSASEAKLENFKQLASSYVSLEIYHRLLATCRCNKNGKTAYPRILIGAALIYSSSFTFAIAGLMLGLSSYSVWQDELASEKWFKEQAKECFIKLKSLVEECLKDADSLTINEQINRQDRTICNI